MNNLSVGAPFLTPHLAARSTPPSTRSMSLPSGVWSPGQKLMGNIRFANKALLICLMFVLPMAWLAMAFYTSQRTAIEFSVKESLGIKYNRVIFPILNLAQQLRREATNAAISGTPSSAQADIKSRLQIQQAALGEIDKKLGTTLQTEKAYAAVQAAYSEAEKTVDKSTVFSAHTQHVDALIALMSLVTDNSNLTLDPDIDSYYLMDAVFFRIPDIVESSGKLRGTGLAVMKSGTMTPVQQQILSDTIPVAEFQFRNMREGLAKAFANNASLSSKIDSTPALEETQKFFGLARQSVVNAQDFAPETQAKYLVAANKAIDDQYALPGGY